jgi:hypothetical protein
MARYQATVKGGFWSESSGNLSSIKLSANDFNSTRAVQALSKKGSFALRELLDNLTGQAPGNNVRFGYTQIAPAEDMGGKRQIDQTYLIDRNTTPADVVAVKTALTEHSELTHTVEQRMNGDRNPLGTR